MKLTVLPSYIDSKGRERVEYEGKLVSPTEIDTFKLCKRKWAWRWIEKDYGTANKFAQLGIDVHQELEDWIRHQKAVQSDILIPSLKHFPMPGEGVVAERMCGLKVEIGDEEYGFQGKIDVSLLNKTQPQNFDLKTTGDFKWAKTPEDLLYDTQRVFYGIFALAECSEADSVLSRWVYALTAKPHTSKPVELISSREQTEQAFKDNLIPVCHSILEHTLEFNKAMDVEPDYTGCSAFGGCPYKEKCNVTPQQSFRAAMAQDTTSKKASQKQSLKVMQDDATSDVTSEGKKMDAATKMAALLAKKKGTQAANETVAKAEKVAVQANTAKSAINPPDSASDDTTETLNKAGATEEPEAAPAAETAPEKTSVDPVKEQKTVTGSVAAKSTTTSKKSNTAKASNTEEKTDTSETVQPALIVLVDCKITKGFANLTELDEDGGNLPEVGFVVVDSTIVDEKVLRKVLLNADVVVRG